jgi:hypothetical protein
MVGSRERRESIGANGRRRGLGSSSLSMLRDLVRSCCLIWGGKGGVEEDASGFAVEVAEGMFVSVGAGGIIVVVARTDQRRVRVRARSREGNDDMGGSAMDLMMAPHVLRATSLSSSS